MGVWGLGLVLLTVIAAVGGMLIVRRSAGLEFLESHNEVAGFIYAVIGVVYAVLLAFCVIVVWERHEEAALRVEQEANALGDLYRNSQALPEEVKQPIERQLREYARAVIDLDWPAMGGESSTASSAEAYRGLWTAFTRINPGSESELIWLQQSAKNLDDLGDARRLRLLSAKDAVPGIMWTVLLIGAAITIIFSYFFGARSALSQALMVAALSAVISLVLFLVAVLQNPFAGAAAIEPVAFQQVIDLMTPVQTAD